MDFIREGRWWIDQETGERAAPVFEGGVAPLVVAGIVAGSAILSSLSGRRAAKKQRKRAEKAVKRARAISTPQELVKTSQFLRPQFREQIAASLGPQIQGQIANINARRGLTTTGLGTTFALGALTAPEIAALNASIASAERNQRLRAEIELRGGGLQLSAGQEAGAGSTVAAGLRAGAAGFFGASRFASAGAAAGTAGGGGGALFPNLIPQQPQGPRILGPRVPPGETRLV